jgi:pimeloyl-ACP methyl ester carboxylesterase
VCLHGLSSNARWWDLVADRLSPRWRVVAPDLRGHGESDKPDTGYSFDAVASDLGGLLAALRLPAAVWIGHSWGASVALAAAAAEPGRALGVVCVDGGPVDARSVFGATWEQAEARMSPPRLDGVDLAVIRGWAERSLLAEGSDPETAAEILLGNFEEVEPGRYRPRLARQRHMEIARHIYELDATALLRSVPVPVLLVFASGGDARWETAKRAAADAALGLLDGRGTVTWIDGVHDLPVQRPSQVAAAIAGFLETLTDQPVTGSGD